MNRNLRIAICQFPVSHDIAGNAKFIRRYMKKAADANAHVVHFPETALSGYERADFTSSDTGNWQSLEEHTKEIASLAAKLGLWVVSGSCRKVESKEKPANCIYVISDKGRIVGIYDKQKLTPAEVDWYTRGKGFLIININGIKCGFLICYELRFPVLFEAYRKKRAQLIFHSCHNVSRKLKSQLGKLALAQLRTRASDYQMCISSSNSSARNSFTKTCVARPDGSVRSLRKHFAGMLLHDFTGHILTTAKICL